MRVLCKTADGRGFTLQSIMLVMHGDSESSCSFHQAFRKGRGRRRGVDRASISPLCHCVDPFKEMKAVRVPLSRLVVFLLLFTPGEGHFRVIGSHEPIVAAQGDDVILPCHVEPRISVARYTVEWSRPDLKPDPNDRLSRVEYVHLYRDSREVPDMKISSYVKRTALSAEGLIRGDISLKIMNVTLEDRGRYRCFIPKLKSSTEKFSIVHLVVEPVSTNTSTTETSLQPRDLPAPNEMDVEGGSSSLTVFFVFAASCVVVMIGVGVISRRLTQKCQKQQVMRVPTV